MAAASRTAGRWVEFLVRAGLVIGGLVSLRFAEGRVHDLARFQPGYRMGLWYSMVGLVVLTGLAFGLAGGMPWGRMRFRWTRALLVGVVPLVMLADFAIVAPHWHSLPRWLFGWPPYFWTVDGPQFALAALLGLAIASGFAPRREAGTRTAGWLVELLVRIGLVVGGLVSLRFAESRFDASTHSPSGPPGNVYLLAGLLVLTGLAFGLAAGMPWGRVRYRWSRALLVGVVPLVMVAHFAYVYGLMMPHWWRDPSFLLRFYFWIDVGPQFALAVLVGVAVASGVVPRKERT